MNKFSCLWLVAATMFGMVPLGVGAACPKLLDHRFEGLQDGKPVSLCGYAGKVILAVNTASFCGYTSQYEGLERLYEQYRGKGLVVMGFPSNEFGQQEPGSNTEIAEFCRLTYGIQFPMVARTSVRGAHANAFYKDVAKATAATPQWNFHKYLIHRDATNVASFGSAVRPDDPELLTAVRAALDQ